MSDFWDTSDEATGLVVFLLIVGFIALLFLGPAIVMWLWNWIAVDLFAAPVITYWQAFGLKWLCSSLFGRVLTVKSKG